MHTVVLSKSICLSVKRVHYDKTISNFCSHFYTIWILIIIVFRQEDWFVGQPVVLEILGQTDRVRAKTLIFNRYSFVWRLSHNT